MANAATAVRAAAARVVPARRFSVAAIIPVLVVRIGAVDGVVLLPRFQRSAVGDSSLYDT